MTGDKNNFMQPTQGEDSNKTEVKGGVWVKADELPKKRLLPYFVKMGEKEIPGTLHVDSFKKWNVTYWLDESLLPSQTRFSAEDIWKSACNTLLADMAYTFSHPDNLNKAETIRDKEVFQALAETVQNFPLPKLPKELENSSQPDAGKEACEWIDVNESLPEDTYTDCLVFCEQKYGQVGGMFTVKSIYRDPLDKGVRGNDAYNRLRLYITHWMKLPAAPKQLKINT